jgi:hypothetical protein
MSRSRVAITGCVVLECRKTICGVIETGGVAKECTNAVGRIVEAAGIL